MNSSLRSIAYMFIVTLVFAALVSGVKIINQDRIESNQALKLQGIILKVLKIPPGPDDQSLTRAFSQRVKSIQVKDKTVYVGYAAGGRSITGYAFPVGGPGFWGPIYGMAAVDPQGSKLLGLAFYKHSETPGLGGRMTEKWFQDQFTGLAIEPVAGDKKIFYLKAPGSGAGPNDLDAITGATRTSGAIEIFLNQDLDRFLTQVWGDLKKNR